jgi:hypothetical protein
MQCVSPLTPPPSDGCDCISLHFTLHPRKAILRCLEYRVKCEGILEAFPRLAEPLRIIIIAQQSAIRVVNAGSPLAAGNANATAYTGSTSCNRGGSLCSERSHRDCPCPGIDLTLNPAVVIPSFFLMRRRKKSFKMGKKR